MSSNYDVLVVGELNVDLILNQIDGFPEMSKEKLAGQMTLTLGSSSAIFASNLSSLGAKVAFVGKIGNDSFGDLVIDSLNSKGVKTEMIIRDAELKTGATIVLNYDQDRAMVTHAGAMEHLKLSEITKAMMKQARHLHFSSVFLQPGIRPDLAGMFKQAKDLGLTTSFDAQWDPDEKWDLDLKAILPFVDVFLPNELELKYLTGCTDQAQALAKIAPYAHTVALKLGSAGSLCVRGDEKHSLPPFLNKNVVDAIGAGDSFNAGFIYKFINGSSLEECQKFANMTGAVSTTAAGGTTAFTSLQGVLDIARKKLGYQE